MEELFIANPDLLKRFGLGRELNTNNLKRFIPKANKVIMIIPVYKW